MIWDCVVIGAGPAGLTAGIYLARYRHQVLIYDCEDSRAKKIPLSHNYPGFPEGISGADLLKKLNQQLAIYKVPIKNERVISLKQLHEKEFLVQTENTQVLTKTIILATGVKDNEVSLEIISSSPHEGLIRYCPVCDAYEIINKKIAILGHGKQGLAEAIFLKDYTQEVTLVTLGQQDNWTSNDLKTINESQVTILSSEVKAIEVSSNITTIQFFNQEPQSFDCMYFALGCTKNNSLANSLKLKLKKGSIVVNEEQETSVKGVFAAGDIVSGLHQICVATSQAAIAATAVHKLFRRYTPQDK